MEIMRKVSEKALSLAYKCCTPGFISGLELPSGVGMEQGLSLNSRRLFLLISFSIYI